MKQKYWFIIPLLASSSVLAMQSAPVYQISGSQSELVEQLKTLERKLDARNKAQVLIQQQLDDLQNEVNELRGITELHSHQLSQVIQRQRELYQELDKRVSQALTATNAVPSTIQSPQSQVNDTVNDVNYSNNLSENEQYDRAVNLVLKDKQYDQAIAAFERFNQQFPDSGYAANAHYWLGQLLFTKGQLEKAAKEFQVVVDQYKDSSKRPDSLLKTAIIAQKQNNIALAQKLYQLVISEYAGSTSAQLAESRLDGLTN